MEFQSSMTNLFWRESLARRSTGSVMATPIPEHCSDRRTISDRAKINPARKRYFGEHRPASTLVEVSALVDPRMKVEIEAVAVID